LLGRLSQGGWNGHIGEMRNAYKTLVRKLKCRRPHGTAKHRWEDNIKMDLK